MARTLTLLPKSIASYSLFRTRNLLPLIGVRFLSSPAKHTLYSYFPLTLPRGPPPAGLFDIDLKALKREYLQAQAKTHPDRALSFHAESQANGNNSAYSTFKENLEQLSAELNKAYQTLISPLSRAEYILSLNGIDTAQEGSKLSDPVFLGEIMEVHEAIEEAQNEEDVELLRSENISRVNETTLLLEKAINMADWNNAKDLVVKLRYWINISNVLKDWEPGMDIGI
ncbi:Co-chaperone Hsc20 [Nadsonia fulvescens var. elongata DSM 6958]|uniref:Co-chaperone Hsc20 n=1 Tax=Nadsonia fulvescens var. elongata DSM 6958 TaxID=857566 RepID=A0A1E3PR69_9ASCO|nr:Co-chaperone Hsc20 [Nadsonia fulvescens var. elongata DSM 6958]